jgi:hypothetical protein
LLLASSDKHQPNENLECIRDRPKLRRKDIKDLLEYCLNMLAIARCSEGRSAEENAAVLEAEADF